MTPRHREAGFSLQELLVSIVMMGVVTTIAAVMYSSMASLWQQMETRAVLDDRADRVFETMAEDFSAVISPRLTGTSIKGASATARDDEHYFQLALEDDKIILPILTMLGPDKRKASVAVLYQIQRDQGQAVLTRTFGPLTIESPKGLVESLDDGVIRMKIEYAKAAGGEEWVNSWTEPTLPRAVRVSLVLVDNPAYPREQVARKAVFAVPVE
ncbi:MAG: hypothetical protein HY706_19555 [Candidatus Hydrogenedentes bacterium]|nr:hypothetical protein [Candidatus Hydrogenedentota bacterium]